MFVALAHADYLIDDSNTTTIQYVVNPDTKIKWGPYGGAIGERLSVDLSNGTLFPVDDTLCYNDTFTYGACGTSDGCYLEFPFTGSGATIYVLQAGSEGINVSVTVDGGPSTISVLAPIGAPSFSRANVSLFDVQSLTSNTHNIALTVSSWAGTFSGMMLDYIAINQSLVTTPTSTSTPATASATTSSAAAVATVSSTSDSNSHSKSTIGVIVGGVVGGLAVVTAVVLVLFFCRRHPDKVDLDQEATSFNPNANPVLHPSPTSLSYTAAGVHGTPTPSNPMRESQPVASTPPPSEIRIGSDMTNVASGPQLKSVTDITLLPAVSRTLSPTMSFPNAMDMAAQLTDEQADFVNNLHRNNVPASAIARVMERMMGGGGSEAVEDGPLNDNMESQGPPSYDFHGM